MMHDNRSVNFIKQNFSTINYTKTQLNLPIYLNTTKRFMLRTSAKIITEVTPPLITATTQKHTYASYIVTNDEAKQDDTFVSHPTIIKTECDNPQCNENNCATTNKSCDINTEKSAIIGIKSHIDPSDPKLETNREAIHFDGDHDARGNISAVIFPAKEPIPSLNRYDNYRHSDSEFLQKDDKTAKLNAITKKQPIKEDENKFE